MSSRFASVLRGPGRVVVGLICAVAFSASSVVSEVSAQESAPEAGPDSPAAVGPEHAQDMKRGLELFRDRVRPILIEHCLECHGGETIKADFSLATREALMESGTVEESAEDSYLLALVRHDEEPHMPFQKPRLPDDAIEALADWIDLGAPYAQPLGEGVPRDPDMDISERDRSFWSFQPLQSPDPPQSDDDIWSRSAIDRFVMRELRERGMEPNGPADRRTLIRRAYLDLIGLPPKPEEVEAFVHDPDPLAYEKLIDRLLDSPHYGERWARHWMDVARFAESHGYEQDYDRPHAYHYRDFLIRALNQDLPYDRFVQWQVAGDELAPADPLAMMATGFLGAGVFPTQLTEAEFESARYDELDDMTATLGVAFLGLSIGCARCHDHKYDPIPTRDYYRMASVFTRTIRSEIDVELDVEENDRRRRAHAARAQELAEVVETFEREVVPDRFLAWLKDEASAPGGRTAWTALEVERVEGQNGSVYHPQPDGSWLADGDCPDTEVLTVVARTSLDSVRGLRLEVLADPSLPRNGPGRAPNGNFVLGDTAVAAAPLEGEESSGGQVRLVEARATHEQNGGNLSVSASIDEDSTSGWAVDGGGIGGDHAAAFVSAEPFGYDGGTRITLTLSMEHPNTRHVIGRWRLSATDRVDAVAEVGPGGPPADVALAIDALRLEQRPGPQSPGWDAAIAWFKQTLPEWRARHDALQAHLGTEPNLLVAKVQVNSEGFPHMSHHADGRGYPHFYSETHILDRGDVHQKTEVAEPGFLQVLMRSGSGPDTWLIPAPSGWERTSYHRAGLARWLTDDTQGAGALAARVAVNRLWYHHLGRGIVATPNDFGMQGERPTHPELLDWLARDFIDNGWKLKRLHKMIMTSSTYMQSSAYDAEDAAADPDNRWLWRWSPRRVEAEVIRDSLLAVSGRLDPRMYGPGTLDESMTRRSIYFFVKRSKLVNTMMLFDWPEHLVSIGRRARTTIAPQSLYFMNNEQVRLCARSLAERLEASPEEERIDQAYRLAFGRPVTGAEKRTAEAFLQQQADHHRTRHTDQDARFLARVDLCQALLSLNEFIYLD